MPRTQEALFLALAIKSGDMKNNDHIKQDTGPRCIKKQKGWMEEDTFYLRQDAVCDEFRIWRNPTNKISTQ